MIFRNVRSTLINISLILLLALRWNIVNQNDTGSVSFSSEEEREHSKREVECRSAALVILGLEKDFLRQKGLYTAAI